MHVCKNKKFEEQIIPMSEPEWYMFLFGDLTPPGNFEVYFLNYIVVTK